MSVRRTRHQRAYPGLQLHVRCCTRAHCCAFETATCGTDGVGPSQGGVAINVSACASLACDLLRGCEAYAALARLHSTLASCLYLLAPHATANGTLTPAAGSLALVLVLALFWLCMVFLC